MCNWVKPLFSGYLYGQFKFFRARKTEEGLTPVAGSRALLQHAVRTLGGIQQKQNSTAALRDARGQSQGCQRLGPLSGRPCTWTQICPCCLQRAKYALGEHRIVLLPPSKKGCVRFKKKNELVLPCLPALSPLPAKSIRFCPIVK